MDWGRVREAPSANLVAAMSKVLGASSRGGLGVVNPKFSVGDCQTICVAEGVGGSGGVKEISCDLRDV